MKKFFVLLASLVLLIPLISCKSKVLPDIAGTWESSIMLRSELAEAGGGGDSVKAFLYTKQHILLSFLADGSYTKKILQEVDRIEFVNPSEDAEAAKDYYSLYCNKNLLFAGGFYQKDKSIFFEVESVQSGNDEPVTYDEFFARDQSIGDDDYSEGYEVKNGFLFLNGVKFKKAAD